MLTLLGNYSHCKWKNRGDDDEDGERADERGALRETQIIMQIFLYNGPRLLQIRESLYTLLIQI
jgi:hypothetical protein